jgi:hypothetical protein
MCQSLNVDKEGKMKIKLKGSESESIKVDYIGTRIK